METMQKAILGFAVLITFSIGAVFASGAATNTTQLEYVSSITVPDNITDNSNEIPEAQESTQLFNLAKITEEQARTIAINEIGGTVNKVELDNENGNVVYSVGITKDNKELDVKVDAGNGKVLKIDNGIDDETGNNLTQKEDDFATDGIDHQFEGEGEHED